jgi:hypothetical protein
LPRTTNLLPENLDILDAGQTANGREGQELDNLFACWKPGVCLGPNTGANPLWYQEKKQNLVISVAQCQCQGGKGFALLSPVVKNTITIP